MIKPLRVAHLVSHPIHYFAPLYRELYKRGKIDLTVFFRSDQGLVRHLDPGFGTAMSWDVPVVGGYRSVFLRGSRKEGSSSNRSPAGADIVFHLRQCRCDLLWVHGYTGIVNQLALLGATALGIPTLLRDEANLLDRRSHLRAATKECLLGPLFKMISGGLYIGTQNQLWYQHYGMHPYKLFSTPYSVDNTFFRTEARRLLPQRLEIRQRFGFGPHQTVFLFAGKLIPKKAPLDLLKAFQYASHSARCGLLFAGDGPLREQVSQALHNNSIKDAAITGFLNQSRISEAYLAADVLVLPSIYNETWGLVVNEAMNFGLPIIVSDKVGCATDLVQHGDNGYVFPAGDVDALGQAMMMLAGDPVARVVLGRRSLEIAERYSVSAAAEGIERACYTVCRDKFGNRE